MEGTVAADRRSLGRVLVTCPDELGVLAAVRGLRAAGYEPWVTTGLRTSCALRSRVVAGSVPAPDPRTEPSAFVEAVAAGASRIRAAIVLPGTESALRALTLGRTAFSSDLVIGLPTTTALDLATDKTQIPVLAARAGISSIESVLLERRAGSAQVPYAYPVVVKPSRSETWIAPGEFRHASARLAHREVDFHEAVSAMPGDQVIVQPFVNGDLESVSGISWGGELIAPVHARADRLWPPDCGMIAHAESVGLDPDLLEQVGRLVQILHFDGLLQLQFIRARGGLHLIDINPRVYASLALAIAAGRNLPAIWADLLLGRPPRVGTYRVGVGFRSEVNDLRFAMQSARHRRWRDTVAVLRPHRNTTHAIFNVGRPQPLTPDAALND